MLPETKPRIPRLMAVVPGLRFFPTEQELVGDYLYKKILTGNLTPEQGFFVRDFDLYGKEEPWQVWARFEGQKLNEIEDLYFFTTLKKKSAKGSRISRTVGSGGGTWLCKNSAESIRVHAEDGCCIVGYKKRLTYTNQSSDHNGCWIIHEYSLCPEHHPRNKNNNIVLCRLRKNQPAHAVAFQGNQEKGAKLKKRPAKDKDCKEKSDKRTNNPPKKRKLNNMEEETEQRIDDAQFQVCYSELIETPTYIEPSYSMIDEETSRVQENLPMQSSWTDSTATTGVLEEAAPKNSGFSVKESRFQKEASVGAGMGTTDFGYEDPILDDFSISVPSNIDDLLSVLQSSNNMQTAADKSDFSTQTCWQHLYPEAPEQDPVSPLDMALVPRLFAESPKDCHDNDYLMEEDLKDSFCQSLLQDMLPGVSKRGH